MEKRESLLSMCNVYNFLLLQCFAKTRTAFLLNEAVNFCELFKKKKLKCKGERINLMTKQKLLNNLILRIVSD
jgi:hypothetical protein